MAIIEFVNSETETAFLKANRDTKAERIEYLQQDRQTLIKRLNQLIKKQENQTIDPDALKHELEEMTRIQTLIYAKLEQLPNLETQITALLKSNNFRDLGKALQPIKPNIKEPDPEKPKPKISKLSAWLKVKKIKALDLFAGLVTTGIWLAASGWIIQSFSLTYTTAIGLGVFWLFYIIAFRLMIGGILD